MLIQELVNITNKMPAVFTGHLHQPLANIMPAIMISLNGNDVVIHKYLHRLGMGIYINVVSTVIVNIK